MESKGRLDQALFWANKHADTIVDYTFIIILIIVTLILMKPLIAIHNETVRNTILISNVAFPFIRPFIGKKYKRLGIYLQGMAYLILIVTLRIIYL